jgi:uncharacterized glyoxalase superfamily protein PhnB
VNGLETVEIKAFVPARDFELSKWWRHVEAMGVASRYSVKAEPSEDRPWGLRDFILIDPTGALWRIGEDISES